MREDEIALFLDSFERCMENPSFLDVFYTHFLASSPEVAEKFANTDFHKQKRALKASLYHMLAGVARRTGTLSVLTDVAQKHSRRQFDIRPELYELWLASLVHAASRCDGQFNEAVAQAWREAMAPGIRFLTDHY